MAETESSLISVDVVTSILHEVRRFDILPRLKMGDSYRVQILRSRSPRRVPAADRYCGSLHRRAGPALPLG